MERQPTGEAIRVNEQQDRPRYVIRAHHLDIVRSYLNVTLKNGLSVSHLVNRHVENLEKERASGHISEHRQWYVNDILGSTQEQADRYRRYETEFLEEFLILPDDYPVKIVEDQKDKICQGCAIGEHCSKKALLNPGEYSGDEVYIKVFREDAKEINLEDDLKAVDEIATYSNAKPRKVESILTTAGTVKKVLLSVIYI